MPYCGETAQESSSFFFLFACVYKRIHISLSQTKSKPVDPFVSFFQTPTAPGGLSPGGYQEGAKPLETGRWNPSHPKWS